MGPADERFHRTDPARPDVDLRLVDQVEFLPLECRTQPGIEFHSIQHLGRHRRAVELRIVPARALGVVHRRVGVLEQRRAVATVPRIEGDADAGRQGHLTTLENKPPAHQAADPRCDGDGVLGTVDVPHEGCELVSSQAGEVHDAAADLVAQRHRARKDVRRPQTLTQTFGGPLKDQVACGMAERVVDVLEAIEIHEQHGQLLAPLLCPPDFAIDPLQEREPVGQAGQAVDIGQAGHPGLGRLAFGDVARQDDEPGLLPRRRGLARHRQFEPSGAFGQGQLVVRPAGMAMFMRRLQGRHADVGGRRGQDVGHGLAEEGRCRGRQQPGMRRPVVHVAAVDVELEQQVGDGVQDRRIALLGGAQIQQRLLTPKQVTHAVADQGPVDRLGNEVGGAMLVGRLDRSHVVHASHHDDRQQGADFGTQDGADLVPVEIGHVDIEHDQIAGLGTELLQGILAAFGHAHIESGLAQGRTHDQARVAVVVDHQDRAPSLRHAASTSRSRSCDSARCCSRRVCSSRDLASSIRPSRPHFSSSR